MEWKKVIDTIVKAQTAIADVAETIGSRVKVESIEDETGEHGVKAVWTGTNEEHYPSVNINVDAGPIRCSVQTEGDTKSTFEVWQKDDKRGITLHRPKSITWEVDWEALNKFGVAKGAGLACAAGAAFGFMGWLGLTLAGKFLSKQEKERDENKALEKGRADEQ